MNAPGLRERLQHASSPAIFVPDLERVTRRSRFLRLRRVAGGVLAGAIIVAAVVVPLSALRHLDEGPVTPSIPSVGSDDGRIGLSPRPGWNDLRTNATSVCSSTQQIQSDDAAQAGQTDIGNLCLATARSLGSTDVLVAAYVQSTNARYDLTQPNGDFPRRELPLSLGNAVQTEWEGSVPGVSRIRILGTIDHRQMVVVSYFGTLEPGSGDLALAQSRLADLFVRAPAPLGGAVAFAPLAGWHTSVASGPPSSGVRSVAVIANLSLRPDPDSFAPPLLGNRQIDSLPPDGIALVAEEDRSVGARLVGVGSVERDLPLSLHDARITHGGGEGLTREDLTVYRIAGVVNGRPVLVQAWFGTRDPGRALLRQAQLALDRLVVVPD